jgi:hypothetical protein
MAAPEMLDTDETFKVIENDILLNNNQEHGIVMTVHTLIIHHEQFVRCVAK